MRINILFASIIIVFARCGTNPVFNNEENFSRQGVNEITEYYFEYSEGKKKLSYKNRAFLWLNGKTDSVFIEYFRPDGTNTAKIKYYYSIYSNPDSVSLLYTYPDGKIIPGTDIYYHGFLGELDSIYHYHVYEDEKMLGNKTIYEYTDGGLTHIHKELDHPSNNVRRKRSDEFDADGKILSSETSIYAKNIYTLKSYNRKYDEEGKVTYMQSTNANGEETDYFYEYLDNGLLKSYCLVTGGDTVSKHVFSYKYR